LRKETLLWDSREPTLPKLLQLCSRVFYGLSIGIATVALLCVFFVEFVYINIQIIGFILSGFLFLGVIMAVIHRIVLSVEKKYSCKGRTKINIDQFIGESNSLQRIDKKFVKVAREVFGHIYGVESKMILPTDTADSLRKFGVVLDPFGFEVVMGISQRLCIQNQDDEVYEMVKRVYDKAHSVEDVIVILAEELKK
jgi:hypothetical protein